MRARALAAMVLMVLLAGSLAPAAYAQQPFPDRTAGLNTAQLIEAARARGDIDAETAGLYLAYALLAPAKLPDRYHSDVPWDGTLPLLHLRSATRALASGAARAEIESLLVGTCDTSAVSLPSVRDTAYFHIQYGTFGGGLTIDNYAGALDTAWTQEVVTFGWAAPPVSSNPPSGNRYHVRIDSLGSGLYGYVSTDGTHAGPVGNNPNTAWNDVDAYATCMVLNRNYGGFPGTPLQAMQATVGHEFNHSIQFGYGAITGANAADDAFVEGGATWMEDEAFDGADDNYNYLWPSMTSCMGEYTLDPYPYWITFRGLTERFGTGIANGGEQVMQDFWENTSKSAASNLFPALNNALLARGTTLAEAYHAYAIAVKFNRACGGGYVAPYCLEEGPSYLAAAGGTAVHGSIGSPGGSYAGSIADNYALNWVSLPGGSTPYQATLQNTAAGGQLRGSVVCDTGASLVVTPFPALVGAGASTTLGSVNPASCVSLVAVVTNQAQTADNPVACTSRSYGLHTSIALDFDHHVWLPLIIRGSGVIVPGGQIVNGDFEQGAVAWLEYSARGWPLILPAADLLVPPHSGSWAAWLGGDADETAWIQQQVTVPGGSPSLAYYHRIGSSDVCGYDLARVIVDGTVVDEYDLCFTTQTFGWALKLVNLTAYAGRSVLLQIQVTTDGAANSSLLVDDVTFQ